MLEAVTSCHLPFPMPLFYCTMLLTWGAFHCPAKHLSDLKYTRQDLVLLWKYTPPSCDFKVEMLLRKSRDRGDCIRYSFDEVFRKPDGWYQINALIKYFRNKNWFPLKTIYTPLEEFAYDFHHFVFIYIK